MEKGVSPTSPEVANIPIPSELPTPPDLSSLPTHILRSGAVECLIMQNDDLMSRLSVNLRRISLLEQKISEIEHDKKKAQTKYANLKDQLLILKEKARIVSDRKERSESEFRGLKDQISLLEIQCAEMYTQSKTRQEDSLKRIQALSRRLQRFLNYRKRVQKASIALREGYQQNFDHWLAEREGLQNQFNRQQQELSEQNQKIVAEVLEQKKELLDEHLKAKQELTREQLSHKEAKLKLSESTEYIQAQARAAERDRQKLVESYEADIDSIQRDFKQLESEKTELTQRCQELENLYQKNIDLENSLVFTKRKKEEMREKLEGEVHQLQSSLSHYRSSAKNRALELEEAKKDLAQSQTDLTRFKHDKGQLEEQVESLQCLWKDNHRKIEMFEEKTKALQKLNQQLSRQLNALRKENQNLKTELENKHQKAGQQIKENQVVDQMEKQLKKQEANIESTDDFSPDQMNKIDSLIAEIQSGFRRKEL